LAKGHQDKKLTIDFKFLKRLFHWMASQW